MMTVLQVHRRSITHMIIQAVLRTLLVLFGAAIISPLHVRAQSDTIQTNVPALKDVYAKDFYIGCLLSYKFIGFPTDPPVAGQSAVVTPKGGYLVKFHMNSMTPGNNMKPLYTVDLAGSLAAYNAATTSQAKDSIDTHPIIKFNGDIIAQLNWAKRQGFTFRGHTLVWHTSTPGTGFFRSGYSATGARLTKDKMTQRMENYIAEVIRVIHEGWPGLLSAIDIVNEAIRDGTGADRTSESEWYVTFGDNTYVMKAFEFGRKYTIKYGETQIKLYYNDYNTYDPNKADGIVRLCTPIFQTGYLDGIGMQEHDDNDSPTAEQWIASYNKFYPICTEMAVTELDVVTGSGSPSPSDLAVQANQYGELFKCFVERSFKSGRGKIISVSKDGLNDAYTSMTNQSSSLWDALNQCKPAFYAVANVGMNFNALDSLIFYANALQPAEYTTASWLKFAGALSAAKTAKGQNYSATVSADTALCGAKDGLKAAINGLVKSISSVGPVDGHNPQTFVLDQNYPNPFNPSTTIEFGLPSKSFVSLKIFDALGREVATLISQEMAAGSYSQQWNAEGLPSGVYFYRMQAGSYAETKKLVLLK